MAENNEKTTGEAIVEDAIDEDFQNLLDKFETPEETKTGKKKKKGHIKALIISLIGAVVLVGIVCLLVFLPTGDSESELSGDEASITTKTDSNNIWQAQVKTDSNGKIKENGSGDLLEYVPADISKIQVEYKNGSYTVTSYTPTTTETDPETGEETTTTDTTEYTLVGYEDFDLQSGIPDEVASACSALSFNTVIEADAKDNLADYGLDNPRSVATVTYSDKKKAVIYVGDDAPQGVGTYIKFGSSDAVYLVDSDSVEALLYKLNDFISLTINDSASSTDDSDFKYLNLTGSAYGKKITMKLNSYSDSIANSYVLTAPQECYADDSEASNVAGAIRGLYADSVACVNPTASQLKKYGLSGEYAHVYAKYPDTTVNLLASKPDSEGYCYLMKKGGKIIYKIASDSIPWVTTSYDNLVSSYVLDPQYSGLAGVDVTCNSKTYNFDVTTTVTTTTDDDGSTTSSTTTTVKYNNEELTQAYFEIFYRNMSLLTKSDTVASTPKGKALYTVKYTYSDKKKSADTVSFYKGSGNQYIVTLNSKAVGHIYSSYVDKLIEQVPKVAKDKEVKTFW
jgi:hypothetical protein